MGELHWKNSRIQWCQLIYWRLRCNSFYCMKFGGEAHLVSIIIYPYVWYVCVSCNQCHIFVSILISIFGFQSFGRGLEVLKYQWVHRSFVLLALVVLTMRRLSGKIDFMIFVVYQTRLNQPKITVFCKDVSSEKGRAYPRMSCCLLSKWIWSPHISRLDTSPK